MKKLIPLFVLLAAGIASAEWKLNPYTQRQDYYEATGPLKISTGAIQAQVDALILSTAAFQIAIDAEIARATARENDLGYSTGTIKASLDAVILSTAPLKDYANWNTAYGWGDHSTAGYLTTETDPVYTASPAGGILAGDITNWNTAYGWGDHAGLYLVAPASFTYQAPGAYITALTGDVTASGPGSAVATIVSVPQSAVNLSTITTALDGKLGYTGATSPVSLGSYALTTSSDVVAHAYYGDGSKLTGISSGGGLSWSKYTVTYSDLSAAALTNSISLFTLPAGGIIHAVKIKHSTAFAGTSITAYNVSVGITGTLAKYASAFNVLQAVANDTFQLSSGLFSENNVATTDVKVTATSVGANLSAATQGSVDIWVLTSTAI